MGLVMTKTVFGFTDNARHKPASSHTETSLKIEISLVASLDMILCNTLITTVLIRLPGCAGWSAPLLFANPRRQVFLRQGPIIVNINGEIKSSKDNKVVRFMSSSDAVIRYYIDSVIFK